MSACTGPSGFRWGLFRRAARRSQLHTDPFEIENNASASRPRTYGIEFGPGVRLTRRIQPVTNVRRSRAVRVRREGDRRHLLDARPVPSTRCHGRHCSRWRSCVYRKGFGLASMELTQVLTPATRMRIYSSQALPCLAYLLLCGEGLPASMIAWARHLPDLSAAAHRSRCAGSWATSPAFGIRTIFTGSSTAQSLPSGLTICCRSITRWTASISSPAPAGATATADSSCSRRRSSDHGPFPRARPARTDLRAGAECTILSCGA